MNCVGEKKRKRKKKKKRRRRKSVREEVKAPEISGKKTLEEKQLYFLYKLS